MAKSNGKSPPTEATENTTDAPTDTIDFDVAVLEAKTIIAQGETDAWRLGELAHKIVHPTYGDHTLAKFAAEIGVAACTLKRRRSVYRAWIGAPAPQSYATAAELATHPKRDELVKANPAMKKSEARKIMQAHRGKPPKDKGSLDWRKKENQRWFARVLTVAHEAIKEDALPHSLSPEQLRILKESVEPKLCPTLREGGAALIALADYLEKLEERVKEAEAEEAEHKESLRTAKEEAAANWAKQVAEAAEEETSEGTPSDPSIPDDLSIPEASPRTEAVAS
jgi:hypothetical protein